MKRFASWIATSALAVGLVACQRADAGVSEKLEEMNQRLAAIEKKLGQGGGAEARAERRPARKKRPRPEAGVTYSIPVEGSPARGPDDAEVTIVEAFEFACPYCEQSRSLVDRVLEAYEGDVRVVYKNFVVHPNTATTPALAACAADQQGKFLEMEELIWEKGFKRRELGAEHMKALAGEIGLDLERFEEDMKGTACRRRIQADKRQLMKVGTSGTPTFYVNGRHLKRRSFAGFKRLIDEELARAKERLGAGASPGDYYQTYVVEKGEKKL